MIYPSMPLVRIYGTIWLLHSGGPLHPQRCADKEIPKLRAMLRRLAPHGAPSRLLRIALGRAVCSPLAPCSVLFVGGAVKIGQDALLALHAGDGSESLERDVERLGVPRLLDRGDACAHLRARPNCDAVVATL